ncbi:RepB family plasmid replication initiator protein (plasmid) [Clostridium perfringens]|uniref:replication initiation protein n=1 Tax=Clostridium perfringens TaxID=1502 RepID=UPI000B3AA839|nr:replication initiation protein [Clostridium perfringens]EGT0690862.1 RepB family plasmid replication initiator protein [Clostridium perfringens]EGT0694134.1 RepB family plasmid replication initiator protein [Clostridium perfringens]MDU3376307.1 RepB family plasmid replication initiator protein [Clostridium perfringens]MDU3535949.1 RepB family plasmid replication initiator protein [Clostridium perfringens]OUN51899.1 hypothetical protein B5G18_11650 [Clostridium perfringens]
MVNQNCRNYVVTHSNRLAYSKYSLSLNAQKLIMILAAHVQPADESFKEIEFTATDLSSILGISVENIYRDLPKITKELVSRLILFKNTDSKNDNNFIQGTFLSTAEYRDGKVILEFSPKVKPYLLALKKYFFKFKLVNTLNFKSKYSIRFYQLFKANQLKGEFVISVNELRELLDLKQKSYLKFYTLKNKVINVAVNEVNQHTDIYVEFDLIKEKRETVALKFHITKNKMSLDSDCTITEEVDPNIEYLIDLFKNEKIGIDSIKTIYEKANHDISKIEKVYKYSKTQNVRGLVGYLIKMVEGDNFIEPIESHKTSVHNFTEREYDKDLEEKLLDATYSSCEIDSYYDTKDEDKEDVITNKDIELMENESMEAGYSLNDLKELLQESLIDSFGVNDYKFWIKQTIDEMKYLNSEINLSFSSSVKFKVAKDKGMIDYITQLIKSMDENLNLIIQ